MGEIRYFKENSKDYVYSYSFRTDRELTHDEIMEISRRGMEDMKTIILEATGLDSEKHNCGSGVENR